METSKKQLITQEMKKREKGKKSKREKHQTTDLEEEYELGWPEREIRKPKECPESNEIRENIEYLDRKYQSLKTAYEAGERGTTRRDMIEVNSQVA